MSQKQEHVGLLSPVKTEVGMICGALVNNLYNHHNGFSKIVEIPISLKVKV